MISNNEILTGLFIDIEFLDPQPLSISMVTVETDRTFNILNIKSAKSYKLFDSTQLEMLSSKAAWLNGITTGIVDFVQISKYEDGKLEDIIQEINKQEFLMFYNGQNDLRMIEITFGIPKSVLLQTKWIIDVGNQPILLNTIGRYVNKPFMISHDGETEIIELVKAWNEKNVTYYPEKKEFANLNLQKVYEELYQQICSAGFKNLKNKKSSVLKKLESMFNQKQESQFIQTMRNMKWSILCQDELRDIHKALCDL